MFDFPSNKNYNQINAILILPPKLTMIKSLC